MFLVANIVYGLTLAIAPSILRFWSESGGTQMWYYTTMYTLASLVSFFAMWLMLFIIMMLITPTAGVVLHKRLLDIIMRAPLSYLANTDTGIILNRFAQDIEYVDQKLPYAFMFAALMLCKLVSQLVLLYFTQPLATIGAPCMFLILYTLQKVYLRTSRQVRYLDIELRAEVLSNFLETVGSSILH